MPTETTKPVLLAYFEATLRSDHLRAILRQAMKEAADAN
jgi:hypothetical protein